MQHGLGGLGLDAQGGDVALNFQNPQDQVKEKICFGERLNADDADGSPTDSQYDKVRTLDKYHLRVRVKPGQTANEILEDAQKYATQGAAVASDAFNRFFGTGAALEKKENGPAGTFNYNSLSGRNEKSHVRFN